MAKDEKGQAVEATREQVQNWLMAEGWKISEQPHPAAKWLFRAEDEAGRRILVGQNKARPDLINLEARVDFTDEHRKQFEILSEERRNEILWNLRFRLLMMNVEFVGVAEPMMAVMLTQKIYLDGLTMETFLQRFLMIRNAVITVIWSIMQFLEDVEPPGESTKSKKRSARGRGD